ncbi:hypothetical protein HPP92_009362 [Vanilla planifolia]|uniref:Uncharacterized protein n=1 Tax=Vanilla planifolia TaxID=51239 RepID=A0A835RF51_VANPL|nr:hypothetical protein HPP92_009362 [Vanilla planifolia]
MERSEPTLVPGWYKGSSSSSTSNGNSTGGSSSNGNGTVGSNLNHHGGSSLLVKERSIGFSSRNKFPVNDCDQDVPYSLTERTLTSFRRSVSSNGSVGSEKDLSSCGYSNFGRSHREKDLDIHDRDRTFFLDNGFFNHPDSSVNKKSQMDHLRRSQSMLSGRRVEPWRKRPGHDSGKFAFERDFPLLGSDEKYLGSDLTRVSSPGVSSAIHNHPVSTSGIIGSDGWTSALAEVPPIARGNDPVVLPTLSTSIALSTSVASTIASSSSTGLNMAETLAQAPVRVRPATQLPNDSQKIEELHRQQILKLRPVTPSMPKSSVINSVDKSKTKLARTIETSGSKSGQQSLAQNGVLVLRPAAKSDASKTPQTGNFQVLNREKNGSSPTGKDFSTPANDNRAIPSTFGSSNLSAITSTPQGSNSLKLKGDGRLGSSAFNPYGEKKTPSQTQNRIDFFNSLRKKAPPTQHTGSADDPSRGGPSSNMDLVQQVADNSAAAEKDAASSNTSLNCSVDNGECSTGVCDTSEKLEEIAPDEEEAAFLRSLGWDENSVEEALTHEEIESFLSEYKKRRPESLLKNGRQFCQS